MKTMMEEGVIQGKQEEEGATVDSQRRRRTEENKNSLGMKEEEEVGSRSLVLCCVLLKRERKIRKTAFQGLCVRLLFICFSSFFYCRRHTDTWRPGEGC